MRKRDLKKYETPKPITTLQAWVGGYGLCTYSDF